MMLLKIVILINSLIFIIDLILNLKLIDAR